MSKSARNEPPPRPEPREVTPEMRQRTKKTFGLLLLAFVTGIGMMIAAMSWQGRVKREYGQEVYRAVVATDPSPYVSYQQKCVEALPKPLPAGVVDCDVQVDMGKAVVTVKIEGNRQYRVDR